MVEIPQENQKTKKYYWSNKIVLVVEDQSSNFELIKAFVRGTGIKIVHLTNGYDAINYIKNNYVDLILMDIQLPILTGDVAIKLIKQIKPSVPIIAQTAYAMAKEREAILKTGCDAYFAKPLNHESLIETMNELMNR